MQTDQECTRRATQLASELVRAFAAVANILDDREDPIAGSAPEVVETLEALIAGRLREFALVFGGDELDSMSILLGEAIDNLGVQFDYDPWAIGAFRRRPAQGR